MRGQSQQYNCGAAALYNALCALGYTEHSLEDCERRCEANQVEGTPVFRMKRAIKSFGHEWLRLGAPGPVEAEFLLRQNMDIGQPVIMSVDKDSHWVTAVGRLGERYLIADSEENELVVPLLWDEVKDRWYYSRNRSKFFGLVVK